MENWKRKFEVMAKQHDEILKRYNEVLRLAKNNADSMEYCIKTLEEELKPFQDEYFQGLTNFQIAELAKKSTRITKENNNLIHLLEDIDQTITTINSSPVKKMKEIQIKIKETLNA